MSKLEFKKPKLEDKELLDSYLKRYGENSCQHSFVTMYCLESKYGDMYCESDGNLFVLRSKLCTDEKRVYLFPLGDENTLKTAIDTILEDAREYNASVEFFTLTKREKELIENVDPGEFAFTENRDYAEYVYSCETLRDFPGRHLSSKRSHLRKFMEEYGDDIRVECFSPENDNPSVVKDIICFQKEWLEAREDLDIYLGLLEEDTIILKALKQRKELGIMGVAVYVADQVAGYAYGVELSEDCIDEVAEKGDLYYESVYQMVNHAFAEFVGKKYKYINKEEDVGLEGLRKSKLSYGPAYLIEKYVGKNLK